MITVLLQLIVWTAFIALLIFWPAGTLAFPAAWVFIAMFAAGGMAMTAWLAKHDPALLRERMSPPVQRDQKPWDRAFLLAFMVGFCVWVAFMGWDAARTGFDAVPVWLQAIGAAGIAGYMLGAWYVFRENSFAAPVVKIQEGQRVIDTGPYAIVRHPMYTSALGLFAGLPLLLGSWWGLALATLFILGIAWRAVREEDMLRDGLPGYDGYTKRVRYRFVPLLW